MTVPISFAALWLLAGLAAVWIFVRAFWNAGPSDNQRVTDLIGAQLDDLTDLADLDEFEAGRSREDCEVEYWNHIWELEWAGDDR